jgi:hypothetical protein
MGFLTTTLSSSWNSSVGTAVWDYSISSYDLSPSLSSSITIVFFLWKSSWKVYMPEKTFLTYWNSGCSPHCDIDLSLDLLLLLSIWVGWCKDAKVLLWSENPPRRDGVFLPIYVGWDSLLLDADWYFYFNSFIFYWSSLALISLAVDNEFLFDLDKSEVCFFWFI